MTSPCEFCNDTFDLAGNPELGPCVCCTPQAMRDLREMYEDAEEDVKRQQETINALDEDIEALQKTNEEHADTIDNYETAEAERAEAWPLLIAYLDTFGIPSTSVRYDNPELDALVGALR